ncbi:MAG: HlyD family secretion protein [Chromatiales bacterium]|nr:HlyD family secretion protein [Chromatiales bacterium]
MPRRRLFRQQVLDRNSGLDGPLLLRTPPFLLALSLSAIATAVLVVTLLWQGQYSARLSVPGYLRTASSVLQVTATRDGRLGKVFVSPMATVTRGQPLFELLASDDSTSTQYLLSQQLEQLAERHDLLDKQQQALEQARQLTRQLMEGESTLLQEQRRQLLTKQDLLRQQLGLQTRQEKTMLSLASKGYIPEQELLKSSEQVVLTKINLLELLQNMTSNKLQQDAIHHRLSLEKAEWSARQLDMTAQKSLLESEALRLQQSMAKTVLAPRDGKIGEVHAYPGSQLSGTQTVISLYQPGEPLLAELAIPARLAPSISAGMEVRMTLDDSLVPARAELRGMVTGISATPLAAGAKMGPLTLLETSFRVQVRLQALPSHLTNNSLTGIHRIVSAQLIGPPRSVIQWLLRPLQQLKASVV